MNTALWIAQGVLAFAFLAAGAMKLLKSREALLDNPQLGWAEDFSAPAIKLIGASEVAGAVGVVAPMAAGIAPWLTPIAAAALGLVMVLAAGVHLRRGEGNVVLVNVVLLGAAGFVAWGRWPFLAAM